MFKGCKTVTVVELHARVVCSRMGWNAGLITPHALVRGLGESLFMIYVRQMSCPLRVRVPFMIDIQKELTQSI
jgi:hypothetical protein